MPPTFPTAYLFRPVSPELMAEKRSRGRCVCWGCRRRADKRSRKLRCHTCQSRIKRLQNEDYYAYSNLRSSARKRGIGFELSFEDFQEFCAVTGYIEARGKEPHSLSVDRIKTDLPYTMGNIRILTYADNVSHKYEEYADRARTRRRRAA